MSTTANQGMKRDRGAPTHVSPSKRALSDLLHQDFYLEKVLSLLVEDDCIPECRRVCRKWDEVCRRLPVKLRGWIPEIRFADAADQFPNATSIAVRVYDEGLFGESSQEQRAHGCSTRALAELVQRLTSLKHLQVEIPGELMNNPHHLGTMMSTTDRLQSLWICAYNDLDSALVASHLHALTNLTRLSLSLVDAFESVVKPFSSLQKLRDIEINPDLWLNHDGELVFPSGTNLTRLAFIADEDHNNISLLDLIKASLPYAFLLRRLDLTFADWDDTFVDCSLLSLFTRLEELSLPKLCCRRSHVLDAVEHLSSLYLLRLQCACDRPSQGHEQLLAMAGLRSLSIRRYRQPACQNHDVFSDPFVTRWTYLSNLSLQGAVWYAPLGCLSGLRCLQLRPVTEIDANVIKSISQLSHLERLWLDNAGEYIPSYVLSNLTKLEWLWLALSSNPDADLVPVVASLPRLTHLSFSDFGHGHRDNTFLVQLNLLSNLRSLEVLSAVYRNPCDYLRSGSLSRLRELQVHCVNLTDQDREELYRRLPCLQTLVCLATWMRHGKVF